jgi:Metallopeptidase family M24
LRRELSHLELVDATGLFWRLRMIKTPAEIACLRRAVEIQNRAFRSFASRISRRMTERDLIFEMVRSQGEAGATDIGFVLSITHPAWAFFRAQSAERQMKPGELHWFDAGSTYKGYTCDYDILLAWGDPTADEVAVHKLVRQVYDEALQAWRPGRPVAEIANDTIGVIRRYGLDDPTEGAYLGHSLGFATGTRQTAYRHASAAFAEIIAVVPVGQIAEGNSGRRISPSDLPTEARMAERLRRVRASETAQIRLAVTAPVLSLVEGLRGGGKKRLAGDTAREATSDYVKGLHAEAHQLKELLAELLLENRQLKKSVLGDRESDT